MTLLAYEDAAHLYQQALELAAGAEDRAELLLRLGDARLAAGDLPAARRAYQEAAGLARTTGRPEQLARAALGLGSGRGGFEVPLWDRPQIDLLEEALAALCPQPSNLRAWVMARLSVALSYSATEPRRLALSEAAVGMARTTNDRAALAYALAAHCDAIAGPADCEQRLAEAGRVAGG